MSAYWSASDTSQEPLPGGRNHKNGPWLKTPVQWVARTLKDSELSGHWVQTGQDPTSSAPAQGPEVFPAGALCLEAMGLCDDIP